MYVDIHVCDFMYIDTHVVCGMQICRKLKKKQLYIDIYIKAKDYRITTAAIKCRKTRIVEMMSVQLDL